MSYYSAVRDELLHEQPRPKKTNNDRTRSIIVEVKKKVRCHVIESLGFD